MSGYGKRRGPASDIRYAAGIDRPASRCRRPGNCPTRRVCGAEYPVCLNFLWLSGAVSRCCRCGSFCLNCSLSRCWRFPHGIFPATGSAISVGYRALPSAPQSSHCQLCSIQQRCSHLRGAGTGGKPDYSGRHGAPIRRQLAHGGLLLFQDAAVECHLAGGTGCFVLCRLCPAAHCLLYRLLCSLAQPASS